MHAAANDEATTRAIIAMQLAELQQRFPNLNSEQLLEIEQRLGRNLTMGRALRAVDLDNADEPAFVFIPSSGKSVSSSREVG